MPRLRLEFEVFILLLRWFSKSMRIFLRRNRLINVKLSELLFLYINLDHRVDRREKIENQFACLGISNYERIPATRNDMGALGCSYSHLNAIKRAAESDSYAVICEDDASFIISNVELEELVRAFYSDSRLDVLCLGFNAFNKLKISSKFCITFNTQTAVCYLPKKHVLNDFVQVAEASISGLSNGGDQINFAFDQIWKSLQKKYLFAFPTKRAVIQRPSFSDIENKYVKYGV